MKQQIGKNLRLYRYERGFTQENVAEALNISIKTYARMEQGKKEITIPALINLSQFFKVNLMDLLQKITR